MLLFAVITEIASASEQQLRLVLATSLLFYLALLAFRVILTSV